MPRPAVLVVDPNPSTARKVREALEDSGWDVLAARDAHEAEARGDGAEIRLVLAAASLPRGNGYDLARSIRRAHPGAAVVLMTGGFEVYDERRGRESGVDAHLDKPVGVDELRRCMEDVLGGIRPAAAAGARPWRPLASDERVATLLPRSYEEAPVVRVDPAALAPEIERAILEVLPEVVEAVLRQALAGSPDFRDLVENAVKDAVAEHIVPVARAVVRERLAEFEAAAARADDAD